MQDEQPLEQEQVAQQKLESAGAYGRTIERWWAGFYTGWRPPTVEETAESTVEEIFKQIVCGSRRG